MDLLGVRTLTLEVEISGDKIVVRSEKSVTTQPLDN